MSDRAVLFLISVAVTLLSLAVAGWLVWSGQAAYLDGLFLLATCLVLALAFSLYAANIVRRAMAETEKAAAPAKAPAAGAKAAPARPEERQPTAIG